jgi:hypothetical protein
MNINNSNLAYWVSLMLLLSNMAGCGSTPVEYPHFPTHSPGQHQQHQENDGVAIGLSPVTDPQDMKTYFGANLLEAGLLPIFLVVNNRDSKATFLLEKEGIALEGKSPSNEASAEIDSSGHEALWVATPLLTILFLPAAIFMVPAAASAESDYEELKLNLASREFRSKTLSPGRQTDGFVFFSVPLDAEGALAVKEVKVQIEVEDLKSKKKHQFVFPVGLNTKPK